MINARTQKTKKKKNVLLLKIVPKAVIFCLGDSKIEDKA